MDMLIVALRDIVIDPNQDIDLTSLSEEDALARICKAQGFLPPQADIPLKDGISYTLQEIRLHQPE